MNDVLMGKRDQIYIVNIVLVLVSHNFPNNLRIIHATWFAFGTAVISCFVSLTFRLFFHVVIK